MHVTRRSLVPTVILDALLACALLAIMFWSAHWLGQVPPRHAIDVPARVLMAVVGVPIAVRRLWPIQVLGVITAGLVAYLALDYPYGPVFFPFLIAMYTVASALPLRQALIAGLVAMAAVMVPEAATLSRTDVLASAASLLFVHTWFAAPWVIGAVVRLHRDGVERDREEAGQRRAYEERLRVARDVHDVVGHSLAVINMQAGVALHVLDRRPEQARVALDAIRQSSKDALDELRGTLAVFRRTEPEATRRPAAGLAQLDSVIANVTESGRRVDLEVSGERRPLPAAVDLAAYRIVQESLTNVVRHAGQASATVRIAYEPRQVTVEVTDDGRHAAPSPSGGHGIVGMRERATAVGGSLEAGPRPEGGFRVVARLPYRDGA
jgi:signal transduction histidine kinase